MNEYNKYMLSTYIADLQKLLETEGDMKVAYSIDEEGNCYNPVGFEPSIFYRDKTQPWTKNLKLKQDPGDADRFIEKEDQEKIVSVN